MVAREGFVYEQKPLSVTRNVVVWEGWSLVRVVVRQGFYCIFITIQYLKNCCLPPPPQSSSLQCCEDWGRIKWKYMYLKTFIVSFGTCEKSYSAWVLKLVVTVVPAFCHLFSASVLPRCSTIVKVRPVKITLAYECIQNVANWHVNDSPNCFVTTRSFCPSVNRCPPTHQTHTARHAWPTDETLLGQHPCNMHTVVRTSKICHWYCTGIHLWSWWLMAVYTIHSGVVVLNGQSYLLCCADITHCISDVWQHLHCFSDVNVLHQVFVVFSRSHTPVLAKHIKLFFVRSHPYQHLHWYI